jgi:MarR family transcriptional regulator, organic hydroperoxide resistance regulator
MKSQLSDNLIATHKLLKKNGLKEPHLMVLLLLQENGPLNVGDVSRAIGFLPASTTRFVRKLEDAGLITRAIDPEDLRFFVLEVTAKGLKLAEEMVTP